LIIGIAVTAAIPHLPAAAIGTSLVLVLAALGWIVVTGAARPKQRTRIADLHRALDESRRGYERLFAAVPCYICVQDRDHHIIEANELYREDFGATDRSLCYEVCKGRATKCPDCIVDNTFSDGQVHTSEEILITAAGRRLSAVVHTTPIYDDDGRISSVMEVFTDITEVKKLQRQLALMGRAVAGMAHRVKNILMGLEGGIFVVNEGLENEDRTTVDEGWEMVQRNVELVSRIVKDLLYCSKERPPQLQTDICPQQIVLDVRDLFADRLANEDIDVRTDVPEPHHTGAFDPDGLHNLLCNLVANAADACRFDQNPDGERHTITLRCRRGSKGETILQVSDTGPGIPADVNGRVFEDFFSTKGTEGTGIGLLVAQKVAEDHGGKVSFHSPPGGGTTFTVTLPSDGRGTTSAAD
jgi:PAS domain S-box-containing protein